MDREALRQVLMLVLDEGPFSMRDLAQDAGVGYEALRSWAAGRHVPDPETVGRLARAIEGRSERLREFATQLRHAAETGPPS
jgi:transcriptional regulator with XRE-family HTH domain